MAAAEANRDAIIATLRTQLDKAKNDLRNYKFLYEGEARSNREAVQRLKELQAENQLLINERNQVHDRLQRLEDELKKLNVPKGYKKYHQLKSPAAKARR